MSFPHRNEIPCATNWALRIHDMSNPCRHLPAALPLAVLAVICFALSFTAPCMAEPWQTLAPGLDLGVFHLAQPQKPEVSTDTSPNTSPGEQAPTISLLRIDPEHFRLKLLTQHPSRPQPATLKKWCENNGLVAAINASMYREDRRHQSTGFMKTKNLVNNGYINPRFGAFFAFDPIDPSLPRVGFIDRTKDDWEALIKQYQTVIQNFRLINAAGKNLWPNNHKQHSIAAVGMDTQGKVLFIHCQMPMTVHAFNEALLHLPIRLANAMYVEGGPQAAMYVNLNSTCRAWTGEARETLFGTIHERLWPVPNIIGIQPATYYPE